MGVRRHLAVSAMDSKGTVFSTREHCFLKATDWEGDTNSGNGG